MFNMLLLDGNGQSGPTAGGERWEQKQISFAQLPELIRQYLQIASAAADIPITRMLGESPGGLNSTGDADLRNYYDNVSARQKTELAPALNRLDEIIIRSALGARPKGHLL
jgi:phage-related protein (TIGR01555 family)